MNVTVSTYKRTTFTVEHKLRTLPMSSESGRGLYYMPNQDDLAAKEARSVFDAAAKAIRDKAKVPELAVEMQIEKRGSDLVATFSGTVVSRS